jgi:hypothetical protein
MPDSLALPAIALVAAALVALAMLWPQGQGARSPGPFGHPLEAVEPPLVPPKPPLSSPLRGRQPAPPAHPATRPPA